MARPKKNITPEPTKSVDEQPEKADIPQRLCSEIQLFDLCEKNTCNFKKGRFCTDPEILAKFEAISEDEDSDASEHFYADEEEEMDEDNLSYDDGIGDGGFDEDEREDEDY
jgi:hypothetical protein